MAQLENLKECDRVILVNNLPGFQYPVLFGVKDWKAVSIAGIGYRYFAISDCEEKVHSENAKRTDGKRRKIKIVIYRIFDAVLVLTVAALYWGRNQFFAVLTNFA